MGTTNTKAVLVAVTDDAPDDGTASGAPAPGRRVVVLAGAAASTPDPAGLAATLRDLVDRVLDAAEVPEGPLRGRRADPDVVGIASMAETGVPLDADDRPVGGWVRWDGHRAGAAAPVGGLALRVGAPALAAATGVRLAAKVPLVALERLRAQDPARWAALHRWSGVADLVALLLTGALVTDHTLAGRTGAYLLPGADHVLPAGFDAALLAEVGLRPEALPRVARPGEVAGTVRTGGPVPRLRAGTPVVVAGHDHPVGAWGAGVRTPGTTADSLGTAEALCAVLAAPVDPLAAAAAGMSAVRTVEGLPGLVAGAAGGAVVRWWAQERGVDLRTSGVAAASDGGPARPVDAVVLPYPAGRQGPAGDPAARVRVVGDPGPDLPRAVLEGLALHAAWMLREQGRLAGVPADEVVVLGGAGASNAGWLDAKARLTPAALRVADVAEPVAVGAALLALHRAGVGGPVPAVPTRPVGPPLPRAVQDAALDRFVAVAQAPVPDDDPTTVLDRPMEVR
ncbi:gluconokinase/xylulokinase [Cellulomonas marina]|uniref:Gluconokinase/xylulokinase n=1 Tax=Cellulomonas marina TaxID=988821 RepID=A0A1I1A9A4_9CELL|nr:gluconokinase/xylulokinase [Cellulomonas marina]